ncbi:MAG: NAD(+) kinase, partial [Betaproteobacteria bacterium]|nr:NAD(+) kinase [Betaproteobacteria bacterium]
MDQTLSSMVTWLRLRGVEVLAEASLVSGLGLTAVRSVSFADIAAIADLVVSVGGDGTLLGAAR